MLNLLYFQEVRAGELLYVREDTILDTLAEMPETIARHTLTEAPIYLG